MNVAPFLFYLFALLKTFLFSVCFVKKKKKKKKKPFDMGVFDLFHWVFK